MAEDCREKIVSEDYVDFLWKSNYSIRELERMYPDYCIQAVNDFYSVFYVERELLMRYNRLEYDYEVFPNLYTLLQTEHLQASGILQLQNQPVLKLSGEGVILGFIDSGIDYTNSCFRNLDGSSRILEIWDQGDQSGELPRGIGYGSVYGRELINQALDSENPLELVPSRDELGHGTQIASIAAGSPDEISGWVGAAPNADLAVVKLKPAKGYLKQYFMVPEDAIAYQENDIMLGVRFLNELALREGKPLVICIALGSNQGGHEGTTPLSLFLNSVGTRAGRGIVTAAGNEANQRHHFYGNIKEGRQYEEVELRVADGEYGLMMELWSSTPDVLSVSLISPAGEEIPRVTTATGNRQFDFLFERTVVYIDFQPLDANTGEQLIVIRMYAPTPGIWRLRVYGTNIVHGIYNIWLPVTGFISDETVFLSPNPDITLTSPANTEIPVSVAAYQASNNSIYIGSSRGYTRRGRIKPDIAAPGVEVAAFAPGNRFTSMTGTSPAAAIASGAAALLLEWAVVRGNRPSMGAQEIRQLLIRGAARSSSNLYPNRSWGYGSLNLYDSFQLLGRF